MTVELRRDSGFVLVGVIWFLACMALVVAAAVTWIDRSRQAVEAERQLLLQHFEERSLVSRLTWMIATHRVTLGGVTTPDSPRGEADEMDGSILAVGGEIPVGGQEFCLPNGYCLALTDRASRISLSASQSDVIEALLIKLGVSPEAAPRMLLELATYLKNAPVGMPQRSLRSPMEVFVLPAWRPWEERLVASGWNDLVTVNEAALNLNTAGVRVLSDGWRLPDGALQRLLSLRQSRPILGSGDLEAMLGSYAASVPADGWSRLPSSVLLVRLRRADGKQRYEYQLNFESTDLRLPPWQLLERRTLPSHALPAVVTVPIRTTPGLLAAPLVAGPWR